MRTDNPVRNKVLPLCIFLPWMCMVPAVQAAEDGGIRGPLGARAYLHDGIHFDSPKNNLRFKINGKVAFDGGSIFADRELQEAFPDLEGDHADLRTLQFSLRGWLGKGVEFRISIDFANVRQIKDNWVHFTRVTPRRNFPPWKGGGLGAWEAVLRYSFIDLNDGDLSGGEERNVHETGSTPHYRFTFNYINAQVTDRANPPAVEDGVEQTYAARFSYWF